MFRAFVSWLRGAQPPLCCCRELEEEHRACHAEMNGVGLPGGHEPLTSRVRSLIALCQKWQRGVKHPLTPEDIKVQTSQIERLHTLLDEAGVPAAPPRSHFVRSNLIVWRARELTERIAGMLELELPT